MEEIFRHLKQVDDVTTKTAGTDADASALVFAPPKILHDVPGWSWHGAIGTANAVIRLPEPEKWNGKIMIGATPAVRSEFSMDLVLSDIALQRGYAYAACDKGTPMLVLRDESRQMTEWAQNYKQLTERVQDLVERVYGEKARKTYISGASNGGYITRVMLESHGDLFDGGVEWEGVYWHPEKRHILTCLPVYLTQYPIYRDWQGARTAHERAVAFDELVAAGLHPDSTPYWEQYFFIYWTVTLWLYGRNLDPDWAPFREPWSNDWIRDPSLIANYPWQERAPHTHDRIAAIANSGAIEKPLLSVAGNWDCLVPFSLHASAYQQAVHVQQRGHLHRLYEIARGNHVDGLLKENRGRQQIVQPYYEAALYHLEDWVERGTLPPASNIYEEIHTFARGHELLSIHVGESEDDESDSR